MRKPDRTTSTKDKRNALRFKYVWREKVKAHRAEMSACKHEETRVEETPDTEYDGRAVEGDREIRCVKCGRFMGLKR